MELNRETLAEIQRLAQARSYCEAGPHEARRWLRLADAADHCHAASCRTRHNEEPR